MADKVAISMELNVVLSNATGTATRVIKIPNPKSIDYLNFNDIKTAFAPAFVSAERSGNVSNWYYFYDDGNQGGYDEPMTKVEYAEWVHVVKTSRRYDENTNSGDEDDS